jgi:hypothetical protein
MSRSATSTTATPPISTNQTSPHYAEALVARRYAWPRLAKQAPVENSEVDLDDVRIEHMFAENLTERLCSFPECNKPYYALGLCSGHYQQQRFKKSLQPLRIRRPARGQCDFIGCDKVAVNKGLCQGHARQRKKGQSLRPLRPQYSTKGPCRFEGCPKPRSVEGYCAGHAKQHYTGQPLKPLLQPKRDCDFPGCQNRHYALGYCQGHRLQLLEQRPLAPLRQKRGWRFDRGYVLIFEPTHPNARKDGYVPEHTKVMSAKLGRPLERFEEVHHRNGGAFATTTGRRILSCGRVACNHPAAA